MRSLIWYCSISFELEKSTCKFICDFMKIQLYMFLSITFFLVHFCLENLYNLNMD